MIEITYSEAFLRFMIILSSNFSSTSMVQVIGKFENEYIMHYLINKGAVHSISIALKEIKSREKSFVMCSRSEKRLEKSFAKTSR